MMTNDRWVIMWILYAIGVKTAMGFPVWTWGIYAALGAWLAVMFIKESPNMYIVMAVKKKNKN